MRDDTKNGCVADYIRVGPRKTQTVIFLRPSIFAVGNIKEQLRVILPDHSRVLYKFPRHMVGDLCSS